LTHTFHPNMRPFTKFQKRQLSTLFNLKHHPFYLQPSTILTQYPTHIHPPIHFLQNTTYLQQLHLKQLLLPLILLHYSKQAAKNSHF
ncbi:cyclase family protein, partial [Staphylococcus epidermidis]|uniref:cyclase family protein n=1 Tax=Staphylococcus epidermidis TaxID=1282 RepID=UPI00164363A6